LFGHRRVASRLSPPIPSFLPLFFPHRSHYFIPYRWHSDPVSRCSPTRCPRTLSQRYAYVPLTHSHQLDPRFGELHSSGKNWGLRMHSLVCAHVMERTDHVFFFFGFLLLLVNLAVRWHPAFCRNVLVFDSARVAYPLPAARHYHGRRRRRRLLSLKITRIYPLAHTPYPFFTNILLDNHSPF
jgi:hypothetical protein